MSLRTGATLGVALLVGCAIAADAPKSGPQPGDHVPIFEPKFVTGQFASGASPKSGTALCPV
jgi:hypothetical protein